MAYSLIDHSCREFECSGWERAAMAYGPNMALRPTLKPLRGRPAVELWP